MAALNIENIVVSLQIADSLDLNKMAIALPDAEFQPDDVPILVLRLKEPKTAVMFSSKGQAVFTGPKTLEEIDHIVKMIHERLAAAEVKVGKKSKPHILHLVASMDLQKKLDLDTVRRILLTAEYNPERFPGVVYKTDDPNVVILLFNSGKIICNGPESEKLSTAVDDMIKKLSSAGIL